jgi:hypothetical protein
VAEIPSAQRIRELPESRRYNGIIADLCSGTLNDLTVAIIGGALTDIVLLESLEAYRIRRAPDANDGFPNRIPREFGKRVKLGVKVDLYGAYVNQDLDAIRQIRNSSAHGLEVFDFTNPGVAKLADGLIFAQRQFRYQGREAPKSSRARFVHAVEFVTDLLLTDISRRESGRRSEQLLRAGGPISLSIR